MRNDNLPRGIRNNNPANILRTGQRWLGLSKEQTDSRFCQFESINYGIRAFFVLSRTYRKKYGIKHVYQFIARFAPISENNVYAYVSFIEHTEYLSYLDDDYDYAILLYAIIRYENHFSDADMKRFRLSVTFMNAIREYYKIKIC